MTITEIPNCFLRSFVCVARRLPINTHSSQKRPDKFGNILLTNAFSGKHLKENCLAEAKLQLSFKYFVSFHFVLKLFS